MSGAKALNAKALKLRAEDDEDLAIIGACLKGAFGCLNEMAYDRPARRFAAILLRPRWEAVAVATPEAPDAPEAPEAPEVLEAPEAPGGLAHMRTGLHFDHVNAVRYRRLDRAQPRALLYLVSIVSAPLSERFSIILSFQGGGEIFLEVDRLSGHMRDLDSARPDPSPR
jgi:hypothetical protein